jgi:hypothetical protein
LRQNNTLVGSPQVTVTTQFEESGKPLTSSIIDRRTPSRQKVMHYLASHEYRSTGVGTPWFTRTTSISLVPLTTGQFDVIQETQVQRKHTTIEHLEAELGKNFRSNSNRFQVISSCVVKCILNEDEPPCTLPARCHPVPTLNESQRRSVRRA